MNWQKKLTNFLSVAILTLGSLSIGTGTILYAEETATPTSTVEQPLATEPFSTDLYQTKTATELAEMVRQQEVTSEELVKIAIAQVKANDGQYNAVISIREEEALKEARELVDTGQPFYGVPLLLKGLGHTIKGGSNSNGLAFQKDVISNSTGRFAKALQAAGFIVIGQTNYPQLGLKNVTDAVMYGPTGNPWNPAHSAGGSSGGSSAALASGMVPVASGSDAGGSIRIPAAWTSTIGLKPTRGILQANSASERNQVVHFALTRSMIDTTTLFKNLQNPGTEITPPTSLQSLKIAYSTKSPVGTPVSDDAVKSVMEAVAFLKAQGFTVEEVTDPVDGVKLMESYYTIASGTGSLANFLANQTLKRNITIDDVELLTWGLYQTSLVTTRAEIDEAWAYSAEAAELMANFHQEYPLYLTPTTAWPAPRVDDPLMTPENAELLRTIDQLDALARKKLIYDQWLDALTYTPFTQQANLTGEPALSLPTYVTAEGLPMGIQLNAAKGQDELLLKMGELFEANNQLKSLHSYVEPTPEPEPEPVPEESSEPEPTEETESSTTESSTQQSETTEATTNSTTQKPVATTTSQPKKQQPVQGQKPLPKTGEDAPTLSIIVGSVIVGLTVIVYCKKKNAEKIS